MPGTKAGSIKATAKILAKNPNHFRDIGKIGGRNGRGEGYTGGFAGNPELASRAGKLGGQASRRKKVVRNDLDS